MSRIVKNFKLREWIFIVVTICLTLGQVWLDLKIPDYMSEVTILVQTDGSTMGEILSSGGWMLLCSIGSLMLTITISFFAAQMATTVAMRMRAEVYNKTISFSMADMTGFTTGSLITRTTNDITQIQLFMAMGYTAFLRAPFMCIMAISKILDKNLTFSMVTGVAVCVLLVTVTTLLTLTIPKSQKLQKLIDNLNTVVREHLTGVRVVRAYNAEAYQEEKFEKANEEDKLAHRPKRFKYRIVCGITSIQYLASKIKREWSHVYLTSAHGNHCNVLGTVLSHKESFFLTGGNITVSKLLKILCKAGLGESKVYIGECMGYPEERIIETTAKEGMKAEYHSISVVWVVREDTYRDSYNYNGSIPDEAFIRGAVPITKQEVRTQIVAKLGRNLETIIYDIGAGTGSIAIELALANPMSQVYAFEVNPEACQLIRNNRMKFNAYNLTLIEGSAPESMDDIPPASKVFVGGSKGNMNEILEKVWKGTHGIDLVVSAIAVETFAQTVDAFKKLEVSNMEVTQIAVSKTKVIGDYHMLMGQNPIFLISGGRK